MRQAIDDRRIGFEPHAALQPVDEYCCNTRALFSDAGFFFDDRGKNDRFLGRRIRKLHGAPVPKLFDQRVLIFHHPAQKVVARFAAGEGKCFGEQFALARLDGDLAFQGFVSIQQADDLRRRAPFRRGEIMQDAFALNQEVYNLEDARPRRDEVLACLQVALHAAQAHRRDKDFRMFDHPRRFELIGDRRNRTASRQQDYGVACRRARTGRRAIAEIAADAERQRRKQGKTRHK